MGLELVLELGLRLELEDLWLVRGSGLELGRSGAGIRVYKSCGGARVGNKESLGKLGMVLETGHRELRLEVSCEELQMGKSGVGRGVFRNRGLGIKLRL